MINVRAHARAPRPRTHIYTSLVPILFPIHAKGSWQIISKEQLPLWSKIRPRALVLRQTYVTLRGYEAPRDLTKLSFLYFVGTGEETPPGVQLDLVFPPPFSLSLPPSLSPSLPSSLPPSLPPSLSPSLPPSPSLSLPPFYPPSLFLVLSLSPSLSLSIHPSISPSIYINTALSL